MYQLTCSDKAIPCETFPSDDALEEKGLVAFASYLQVCSDRSQQICRYFDEYGDEVWSLA